MNRPADLILDAYCAYLRIINSEDFIENFMEPKYRDKARRKMGESGYNLYKFIGLVKTDEEFSDAWCIRIEERYLSLDERNDLLNKSTNRNHGRKDCFSDDEFERETLMDCQKFNIPTKLVTIKYNGQTQEIYE